MKRGKEYEVLVQSIYKELSHGSIVTPNDKLLGKDSGIYREVDVSIRANLASHDILIVVQAKDLNTPADVNVVGEFKTVVQDVRASKGILICSSGFTDAARTLARNSAIDLCTAHDAEGRNWKFDLKIPVLVVRLNKAIEFKFQVKATAELVELNKEPIQINNDLKTMQFSVNDGKDVFTVLQALREMEDGGRIPVRSGRHVINLERPNLKYKMASLWVPITSVQLILIVNKTGHLKYLDPDGCRGLLDVFNNSFTPSYLAFKAQFPLKDFDDTWQPVDPEEIAITPITLTIEIDTPMKSDNFTQSGFKLDF